jgi:EAL domain-containing protein (putative c-di-GMP-specific phosphodiesterase class I)
LIRAWQTGQVQARRSLREDLPAGEWSGFAERLEHQGLRAVVHVPVLDGHGLPVALLVLLGRYPNQFSSSVMRQFTRNLQQRWSEIWQRCSRPPPPVPQELAIAYRERLFKGGLRMYMQPVVDLVDGRLVKVEALARLDLGDGRVLSPPDFLPLLRQAELDRLFRLGLDQALEALVNWEAQGLSIDIAVNLPPQTLADPACAQWVFDALALHGVDARRLTLEMLETQRVEEAERDSGVQRLLALGVQLAMDDLGSGYSSLRRLASLPFSTIKVDQDLLKRIRFEPVSTISLISAVIQMGRDFGCDVVVEGLEEPGMIEVARLLGARFGQGYGIARPMPADDLVRWNRDFSLAGQGQPLHTCLGALAFQWASIRHRSMHGSALDACPMTAVLQYMQVDTAVARRLHECVHRDPDNDVVAGDLLDCFEAIVRNQGPPTA